MTLSKFLISCALLAGVVPAHAGFSITGTRVIYHEAEGEATVHLQHVKGDKPVLLQTWLDDGSPDAKPGAQDLPFMLTPAVSRVNPGHAQTIRILRIRDELPPDRESLLFFNALEVPPGVDEDAGAGENRLQLAMAARMKFFYRPRGLAPAPAVAPNLLRFTLQTTSDGGVQLQLHNPTPYHMTVLRLALHAADATLLAQYQISDLAPMVAPFSDLFVALQAPAADASASPSTHPWAGRPLSDLRVRYSVINDQGGVNDKQKALDGAL